MGIQFHAPDYFPDESKSFEGLRAALRGYQQNREDSRRFDISEARQRASEDFTRRQSEAVERRQAVQEQRDSRDYRQKGVDRNTAVGAKITQLLREKRYSEAKLLAQSSRFVDPDTGADSPINVDTGDDSDTSPLQAPAAPAPPPPMGLGGLLRGRSVAPVDEEAPEAGPRLGVGMPGAPARRQQDVEPPPLEQPAPAAPADGQPPPAMGLAGVLKPRRRLPSVTMGGQTTEIDPEEQRRFATEQAEQHKQQLLQIANDPTQTPEVRQAAAARAVATGAQATGAEGAQIMNAQSQGAAQRFKAKQQDAHDMTAAQKFQVGMKPRGGGGAGGNPSLQEQSLELRDFNSTVQTYKMKDLPPMDRKLSAAAANLTGDKPLAHREAAMEIAALARGGVPQEGEQKFLYDAIQHSIAGWPDYLRKQWANGDLSDEMIMNLSDAVKQGRTFYGKARAQALAGAKIGLHTDTNPRQRARMQGAAVNMGMDPEEAAGALGDPAAARKIAVRKEVERRAAAGDMAAKKLLEKMGGGGGQ